MHSTLISFYDPLGFPSLFILRGRKILQDLSQEGLQWDETVLKMYQRNWECGKNYLIWLEKTEMKRCIKPGGFLLYRQSRVGLVGQQNNDNKIPMFQGQYILK